MKEDIIEIIENITEKEIMEVAFKQWEEELGEKLNSDDWRDFNDGPICWDTTKKALVKILRVDK